MDALLKLVQTINMYLSDYILVILLVELLNIYHIFHILFLNLLMVYKANYLLNFVLFLHLLFFF